MRVHRIPTRQGHYVPSQAHPPVGPFPQELFARPVVNENPGEQEEPEGATAQNGFRSAQWFRCRLCLTAVREYEIDDHVCPELPVEENQ